MRILAWVTEGGWAAVADAVAGLGAVDQVMFIHVAPSEAAEAPGGALAGLLGRRAAPDLTHRLTDIAGDAAERLLSAALRRSGVAYGGTVAHTGRAEDVLMEAAADADLLIVARDTRDPGPRSIGHAQRFVVDHAPCAVLLVWTGEGPEGEAPRHSPPR